MEARLSLEDREAPRSHRPGRPHATPRAAGVERRRFLHPIGRGRGRSRDDRIDLPGDRRQSSVPRRGVADHAGTGRARRRGRAPRPDPRPSASGTRSGSTSRGSPTTIGPIIEVASVLGSEVHPALLAAASSLPVSDVQAVLTRAVEDRGRRRARPPSLRLRARADLRGPLPRPAEQPADGAARPRRTGPRSRAPAIPTRPWAELAHHLWRPDRAYVERACCAIRAAERALEAVAYDEALTILERAGAALELAPRLDAARAELCLAESLVRARTGSTARGRALCLRAATLARGLGDSDLFARSRSGTAPSSLRRSSIDSWSTCCERRSGASRSGQSAARARDGPPGRRASAADHPEEQVEAARDAIRWRAGLATSRRCWRSFTPG